MLILIYLPLLSQLDIHPILFWTLFLINMTLGGIVPPVGYTLFVMQGSSATSSWASFTTPAFRSF